MRASVCRPSACRSLGLEPQPLRLETLGAQLTAEVDGSFHMSRGDVQLSLAHRGEEHDVAGDDGGAMMPDPLGRRYGGESVGISAEKLAGEEARERRHRQARHLDATETMPPAELDGALEVATCGQHVAADILGIAHAPERCRLQLGRAGPLCKLEAFLVLDEAGLDLAAREVEIAAQEVDAGEFRAQAQSGCGGFGTLEIGERTVQILRHSLDSGKADPGAAALTIVRGGFESLLICGPGIGHIADRHRYMSGHGAEVMQDLAAQAEQLEPLGGAVSKHQATLNQRQCPFVVVGGRLGARGGEIGEGSLSVLSPIEVFSAKRLISPFEPGGSPAV